MGAAWINALAVARVEPQDQMAAMSDLTSARQVVEVATEGLDPSTKEWIEAMLTAAGLQEYATTLIAQGVVSKDHLHLPTTPAPRALTNPTHVTHPILGGLLE